MPEYQLELKQLVDYPRCRIYRKFIQSLIADRNFHSHGGSGLFYYIVLCSLVNFRFSYRRIERTSYLVSPGEWICTLNDLTAQLRLKRPRQALQMLERLQKQHYITFSLLARGRVVKFKITAWQKSNTVQQGRTLSLLPPLDYIQKHRAGRKFPYMEGLLLTDATL